MPSFRTVAIDATGQTQRLTMEAANEAEIVQRLQRQGSIPMRVEPAGGVIGGLLTQEIGRRGMSRKDVTEFTRELAVMLGAGQDLDRSLRFLAETAPNKRVRATTEAVRRRVRDGGALATALAEHPGAFPRLYIGLVRAGEAGGTLASTLERLAALMERERSLLSTVRSAMIYPALLTVAAIGSIVLLLTQILPQFVPLFEQNGAVLPRPTQIMIGIGAFLGNYGIVLLLAIAAAGLTLRQLLRRPGPRLLFDRLVLRIPVVGGLLREVLAARFTRTLGTLLINGVPLIAALGIVRDAVGNTAVIRALDLRHDRRQGRRRPRPPPWPSRRYSRPAPSISCVSARKPRSSATCPSAPPRSTRKPPGSASSASWRSWSPPSQSSWAPPLPASCPRCCWPCSD